MAHQTILHATCVAFGPRAVLITGASGTGKSSLGLALLAAGGALISDDRTALQRRGESLLASCPAAAIHGRIEARGMGILMAPAQDSAEVALVVDLNAPAETQRLPPPRNTRICDVTLPLFFRPEGAHFAHALALYLSHGPAT
ncbi:serine kinase [Alphaproteobacteria bacterium KMM 3653]|uniref:Serine kinase n=1 Tax=Harenicola maris TaxID=2841044 RepID=A0AAP2CXB7_9RHOB|nr:serine kinase [Harenicola maris]